VSAATALAPYASSELRSAVLKAYVDRPLAFFAQAFSADPQRLITGAQPQDLPYFASQLVQSIFRSLDNVNIPTVSASHLTFIRLMSAYLPEEELGSVVDRFPVALRRIDADGLAMLAAISAGVAPRVTPDQATSLLSPLLIAGMQTSLPDEDRIAAYAEAVTRLAERGGQTIAVRDAVLGRLNPKSLLAFVDSTNRLSLIRAADLSTEERERLVRDLVADVGTTRPGFFSGLLRSFWFRSSPSPESPVWSGVREAAARTTLIDAASLLRQIVEAIGKGTEGSIASYTLALSLGLAEQVSPRDAMQLLLELTTEQARLPLSNPDAASRAGSVGVLGRIAAALVGRTDDRDRALALQIARAELAASITDDECSAWAEAIVHLTSKQPVAVAVPEIAELLTYPTVGVSQLAALMDQLHQLDPGAPGATAGLGATIHWVADHYDGIALDPPYRRPGWHPEPEHREQRMPAMGPKH
jgi:hypothetical protein